MKNNLEEVINGEFKDRFLKGGGTPEEWAILSKGFRERVYSACRLNAYMNFRAKLEFPNKEQPHELDEPWYFKQLLNGCCTFFGINCCPRDGAIVEDTQNPNAYKKFCELEKTNPTKVGRVRLETLH